MTGGFGIRPWRRFTAIAFALYAVFLVSAQFEHHDLLCHLRTPQHCTSCASSPLSSDPHALTPLDINRLADAGRLVVFQRLSEGALLAIRSSGRSPPFLL
jgi:hypothetical protein